MLKEAPTLLAQFDIPKRAESDPDEALLFLAHPQHGLVVQLAMTPERLAQFDFDHPPSIPIHRDGALFVAHAILARWAPEVAAVVEKAVAEAERRELRLVGAGDGGPSAA